MGVEIEQVLEHARESAWMEPGLASNTQSAPATRATTAPVSSSNSRGGRPSANETR